MAASRTVVIAGAGIGGLAAAIALARQGLRVVVLEQAPRIEPIGAGIQLSANAVHAIGALDLTDRIAPAAVAALALRVMNGRTGDEIVRMPLGHDAEERYGAPYWMLHRADLQGALLACARANPDIVLRLGVRAEDHAVHARGVTVQVRTASGAGDEHGLAFIGADGLWSAARTQLRLRPPRFAGRTAWRATVPAEAVTPEFRRPVVMLWLGPEAHLVHYPVSGGTQVNIVAIVTDAWSEPGWGVPGARGDLLARLARWHELPRVLAGVPESWQKWALYRSAVLPRWGEGPMTLLGDAAHAMLPFLAQGAAMALEDAVVLGAYLGSGQGDPSAALRVYERKRMQRTARVQRAAMANGRAYRLAGPLAAARNAALSAMGGETLRRRYDWLYDWRP